MKKRFSKEQIEDFRKAKDIYFDHLRDIDNKRLALWSFSLGISLGLMGGIVGNFFHNIAWTYFQKYYILVFVIVVIAFFIFSFLVLRAYIKSVQEFKNADQNFEKMNNLYQYSLTQRKIIRKKK